MHEQDDRERTPSSFPQAQIADDIELSRLEGDALDLAWLGLPSAGWYEKRQRQQDGCPRELAEYEFMDSVVSHIALHLHW